MLSTIKELINKKRELLEAASLIFEDTTNIDDLIIVSENAEDELFEESSSKKYKDAKFSDLPKDLQKTLKDVSTLISGNAKELFKDSKYSSLSNDKWAKESLEKFCTIPSSDGEVGMTRVHASGDCMIQITGHFKNDVKTAEEKLMHKFITELYQKVKPLAQEHDIRLTYEGTGDKFEGYDAYPSIDVGKEIYKSIDESKETDVKKPKELKESFYITEAEDDLDNEDVETTAEKDENDDTDNKDDEIETPEENEEDKDLLDNNLEDDQINSSEPLDSDEPKDSNDNDILDEPMEDPEPIEEPIADDNLDDLLNITIDLKSNTIVDILPVPPDNAIEAIGGEDDEDILNTRIDSGFEDNERPVTEQPPVDEPPSDNSVEEESEDTLEDISMEESNSNLVNVPLAKEKDEPLPPKPSDNSKDNLNKVDENSMKKHVEELEKQNKSKNSVVEGVITEDISLSGDASADPNTTPTTVDTPPDTAATEVPEDNAVTAAVKDKVTESEPEEDISLTDGEATTPASKEELMKKLSNITKSLEDAKTAIMKTI